MRERFSCRSYLREPIDAGTQARLGAFLASHPAGPFGSPTRLVLVAADGGDERRLRGLSTYGLIRNPRGFIVGVLGPGAKNLEDLGYVMERAILTAEGLGLGTCWVGGVFSRGRFAQAAGLAAGETVPAVATIGRPADVRRSGGVIGRAVGRSSRIAWEELYFSGGFDRPLPAGEAGSLAPALEAVRWAPSASNKQPWRIVLADRRWHFYLRRTKGYGNRGRWGRLVGMADLQRIDMGIAMCHFDLAARELGLAGTWEASEPEISRPDGLTEYTATWVPARA
jgi:hypothetical protein